MEDEEGDQEKVDQEEVDQEKMEQGEEDQEEGQGGRIARGQESHVCRIFRERWERGARWIDRLTVKLSILIMM